jgi:hypothetical protein
MTCFGDLKPGRNRDSIIEDFWIWVYKSSRWDGPESLRIKGGALSEYLHLLDEGIGEDDYRPSFDRLHVEGGLL